MIVVDTNVIAYLFLPTERTAAVERLYRDDPEWAAPLLWRSEFRNVLATQVRADRLDLRDATGIQAEAEDVLRHREYAVDSASVLAFATANGCSAYDAEFAVLADYLGAALVTADRRLAAVVRGSRLVH